MELSRVKALSLLRKENQELTSLNQALLERINTLSLKLDKLQEEKRCNNWLRHLAINWKMTQQQAMDLIYSQRY